MANPNQIADIIDVTVSMLPSEPEMVDTYIVRLAQLAGHAALVQRLQASLAEGTEVEARLRAMPETLAEYVRKLIDEEQDFMAKRRADYTEGIMPNGITSEELRAWYSFTATEQERAKALYALDV